MTFMRSTKPLFFLLFLIAVVLLATPRSDPEAGERILYKTINGDKLYLHFFPPAEGKKDLSRPALLCFFGGGWVKGHPRQFYRHCKQFARLGIPAFSAEYRVGREHGTTPFECVKDAKSAIRWLRNNAAQFNIDPNRIIACGASAGGHLVACSALIPDIEDESDDTDISPLPDAMVLFNPVVDTTETGYGADTFGTEAREISPVHHIENDAPPAILFHGIKDEVVSHENSIRFCEKMKAAGNRCEVILFPEGKHGFFHQDAAFEETFQSLMRFLMDTGLVQTADLASGTDASFQWTVQ